MCLRKHTGRSMLFSCCLVTRIEEIPCMWCDLARSHPGTLNRASAIPHPRVGYIRWVQSMRNSLSIPNLYLLCWCGQRGESYGGESLGESLFAWKHISRKRAQVARLSGSLECKACVSGCSDCWYLLGTNSLRNVIICMRVFIILVLVQCTRSNRQ